MPEPEFLTSPDERGDIRPSDTMVRTFPQPMSTPSTEVYNAIVVGIDRKTLD